MGLPFRPQVRRLAHPQHPPGRKAIRGIHAASEGVEGFVGRCSRFHGLSSGGHSNTLFPISKSFASRFLDL